MEEKTRRIYVLIRVLRKNEPIGHTQGSARARTRARAHIYYRNWLTLLEPSKPQYLQNELKNWRSKTADGLAPVQVERLEKNQVS